MTVLNMAEDAEVLNFLDRVARSVRKQFPMTELDDLYQEAWLWSLNHEPTFKQKWDANRNYLWSSVRNHVADYARKEKAAKGGYDLDDEWFYSIPQVRSLLIQAFTPEYVERGQSYDRQPTASGVSDPADVWAMVADVKRGFGSLPDKDRELLWRVFGESGDWKVNVKALAGEAGVTEKVADQRVRDALSRLRRRIGGARPNRGDVA